MTGMQGLASKYVHKCTETVNVESMHKQPQQQMYALTFISFHWVIVLLEYDITLYSENTVLVKMPL